MAAALASPPQTSTARPRRGLAPVALRVAPADPPEVVDLDAAWVEATAPHRIADARDAHMAEVIPLHRTRPRRAVSARVRRHRAVGALVAVGLAIVLALGAGTVGADADGPAAVGQTVTVEPGQTLWDVAVAHAGDGDPRVTLEHIRDLNGLVGSDVPAWTPVVLPASLD